MQSRDLELEGENLSSIPNAHVYVRIPNMSTVDECEQTEFKLEINQIKGEQYFELGTSWQCRAENSVLLIISPIILLPSFCQNRN